VGVTSVSLQDLLRDASAGILNCGDASQSMITAKQVMDLSGFAHNSVGKNSEVAFCDDGYFGGEEFGSGNDDEIYFIDNDDSPGIEALAKEYLPKIRPGLTYQEYGKSDNIDGGYGPVPKDCFGDISEDEEAEKCSCQ
jgi:hypothetical protein